MCLKIVPIEAINLRNKEKRHGDGDGRSDGGVEVTVVTAYLGTEVRERGGVMRICKKVE